MSRESENLISKEKESENLISKEKKCPVPVLSELDYEEDNGEVDWVEN